MLYEVITHLLDADLLEIEAVVDFHGAGLDPRTILVVAPVAGYFADVDLGVEVGREGLAVAVV